MEKDMEKILAVWSFSTIQTYMSIRYQLERYNKTDDDVLAYIEKKHQQFKKPVVIPYEFASVKCPSCGQKMTLHPVNSVRGDQIPDKSKKSQYYCRFCDTSIFNNRTVQEELNATMSIAKMIRK